MLEKEIKIILTQDEYDLVKRSFGFSTVITQVNNYYRSNACAERRISVRVREVGGRKLLQVKSPVSDSGSLAVREETERELGSVPKRIDAAVLREVCGVDGCAMLVGSLTTERALCYDYEGVELALDKNEYLGITDYELEAEYTGDHPDELIAELAALGIDTEKPVCGKYARFLHRLDELGGANA